MNVTENVHAAIIFTDLVGYSKLPDQLYTKVDELNKSIEQNYLNESSVFFHKTWGDAFLICCYDCYVAANIALKLRDFFKQTNWKRIGFPFDMGIRIGVHFARVTITTDDNGNIRNVVGKGVSSSARIEPVVDPGSVFCSEIFYLNLKNVEDINITGENLGERELAKDFGRMVLYKLIWSYETTSEKSKREIPNEKFVIPQINRKITDKDRNAFIGSSFIKIKEYFKEASLQVKKSGNEIDVELIEIDALRFAARAYKHGDLVTTCKIWIGGGYDSDSIMFSEGRNVELHGTNSYNESFKVKEKDNILHFESYFSSFLFGIEFDFDVKMMNQDNLAEYIWRKFIYTIER